MNRIIIFIIAMMYFISQNNYFGWNRLPESDAEIISDGIYYILCALIFVVSNKKEGGE